MSTLVQGAMRMVRAASSGEELDVWSGKLAGTDVVPTSFFLGQVLHLVEAAVVLQGLSVDGELVAADHDLERDLAQLARLVHVPLLLHTHPGVRADNMGTGSLEDLERTPQARTARVSTGAGATGRTRLAAACQGTGPAQQEDQGGGRVQTPVLLGCHPAKVCDSVC